MERSGATSVYSEMLDFLSAGDTGMQALNRAFAWLHTGNNFEQLTHYPVQEVDYLPPIPNPSKIVAIGLNYMDHCREQNIAPPVEPLIFAKFPSALIGAGDEIRWDPGLTQKVDYEAELAVIIGRQGYRIPASQAFDYVAGYTCANDVSARDLQFGDKQWVRGKSLDTFCPLGPELVTRDEVPDPHNLSIRCLVNGQALQDSNTRELIHKIPALIAHASRSFTLYPGDVILTGTPDGVGAFRKPEIYLKPGDDVLVEIQGIGQLRNRTGQPIEEFAQ
ncbi:MAG: FAA hydrolase family protein [Chloroflexi bacterium]|nr:FAA hydrolase family protein [Chloroflexota bacterium]